MLTLTPWTMTSMITPASWRGLSLRMSRRSLICFLFCWLSLRRSPFSLWLRTHTMAILILFIIVTIFLYCCLLPSWPQSNLSMTAWSFHKQGWWLWCHNSSPPRRRTVQSDNPNLWTYCWQYNRRRLDHNLPTKGWRDLARLPTRPIGRRDERLCISKCHWPVPRLHVQTPRKIPHPIGQWNWYLIVCGGRDRDPYGLCASRRTWPINRRLGQFRRWHVDTQEPFIFRGKDSL